MTTTYKDALTDEQCVEICQRLPLGCAGYISAEAIRYALAPLLTERQAAMQGQGGELVTHRHGATSACSICFGSGFDVAGKPCPFAPHIDAAIAQEKQS